MHPGNSSASVAGKRPAGMFGVAGDPDRARLPTGRAEFQPPPPHPSDAGYFEASEWMAILFVERRPMRTAAVVPIVQPTGNVTPAIVHQETEPNALRTPRPASNPGKRPSAPQHNSVKRCPLTLMSM